MLFPTKWFTRSLWKNRKTLAAIAQVERVQQNGRFNWIIAPEQAEKHALQPLLDQVCFESGQRGCLHLTASIEDTSPVVEEFKLNGFTQLGWEHILQYMKSGTDPVAYKTTWRKMKPQDLPAISVLRNKTASLAEKWTLYSTYDNPPQYTLELNGEIAGFAFVIQNGTTAVIIPTISKHVHSPEKLMQSLIHSHFSNFLRLYILLNSAHPQPDFSLLEDYKIASKTKIRMVKHLAIRNFGKEAELNQIANGHNTDVLTPLSKSFKDKIISNSKTEY